MVAATGERRRLMVVAAHPDDETLGFGGVLARYASEGVQTFLVTATRGDRGRYLSHAPGSPEHPGAAALSRIRERELHAAAAVLGVGDVALLDYGDQQVDRAPVAEAVAGLVRHIRRARPQVLLTFGPDGAYGHPDHIAISQLTAAAIAAAGDPAYAAGRGLDLGAPHRVSKLYFLAWNEQAWAAYQAAFKKLVITVDGVERQATPWPDWAITTVVDTRSWWPTVMKAVACHESQVSVYAALKELSPEQHEALWATQSFYRVFSLVNTGRQRESDLFEGIDRRPDSSLHRSRIMSIPGTRHTPLSMEAETFKVLGHQLVDQLAGLLASIPERPVTRAEAPAVVHEAFETAGPLPEQGTDAEALFADTARQLFDHSLFNAHPRFFGYITAPPAPIGILGDFLASALNANLGSWTLSPAATDIEVQTVRWIAELIGFPAGGGLLVSGGNLANIICLLAARSAGAPWDLRSKGLAGGSGLKLVAYASTETHTWIQKAVDMAGLGTDALRWIPTTGTLQMDVAALRRAIEADLAAGHLPFLVVGTAGSVSTGVVDPLSDIAAVCREKGIWFHVDAAYGGFAATVPDAPAELRGLQEADSVAVDPHKWLYAPLEAGCALVRDREALLRTFSYHPPYYHFDDSMVNFVDYGLQNSRGFRALKVWLALRQVGARGYRTMIAEDIALSRRMAGAIERHPELELLTQALSITTFRYVPTDLRPAHGDEIERYLNELNTALLDALQRGGDLFVSNAVVNGRFALRACIVNFHTGASDVDAVPEIVVRYGRTLDASVRPAALVRV